MMTDCELADTIDRMETYAGSFYEHLARALRVADKSNRSRLLAAFPEITRNYGPGSMHDMQHTARRALLN